MAPHAPNERRWWTWAGLVGLASALALLAPTAHAASPEAHGPGGLAGLTGITSASGRYPDPVSFVARGAGQVVLFAPGGMTLVPRADAQPTLRLAFLDANPDPELVAEAPLPGRVSVIRGADPSAWRQELQRYADLRYVDLYPGIDLVVHAADGALKRDFIVAPGAAPGAIAFRYEGARSVEVSPDGALLVNTGRGLLTEAAPFAWQERGGTRELVLVDWRVAVDGRVTYAIGDHDPTLPLVIDPGLDFAAYVGGDGYDEVNAVTTDPAGNVYLAGSTTSVDLPMAGGGERKTLHTNTLDGRVYRSTDAFVMKLAPDGTLVWASFYGGKTDEFPSSLCLDDPPSSDPNVICNDIVASPWGLGGVDVALGLAVAPDGGVAVVGETNATDFPAFPVATTIQSELSGKSFDPTHPDQHYASDAFFVRFDATGSVTLTTYLGGTRRDVARGVAFDHAGDAWVVGLTGSAAFPTTADRFQPYSGGLHDGLSDQSYDAFVARIRPTGVFVANRLAFSTTLGGYGYDEANAVAVSTSGQVVVAGTTSATSLPNGTTNGAQPSYGGGGEDGFVAILARDGGGATTLLQQTYVGGASADELNDVGIVEGPTGDIRRVIVAGATASPQLWTTACGTHAYATCGSDGSCDPDLYGRVHDDGFVLAFDLGFPSTCAFRRYLGGEVRDEANALDVDPATGELYLTGTTWSADFPTVAAVQPKQADGRSAGCLASDPFDCVDNSDAFFARVSADGKDLLISSFLGGKGDGYDTDDAGYDLAFAATPGARHLYLGGQTYAADFPSLDPKLTQPTDVINVANGYLVRAPVDIADLRITEATLEPAVAERGQDVTLTVKVRNDGPESTDHVKLRVKTAASHWVNPPNSCALGPDDILCDQPKTLARGESATYTLTFKAPDARQKLALDLLVTGDRRDPNDANNRRHLTLPVGGYDVAVAASASPDPVGYGKLVTYTITAANAGPETAENVAVELTFDPAVATFVPTGTTAGCAVGTPANTVVCTPVDLGKDGSVGPLKIILRAPEETKDLRATAAFVADGDPDDDQHRANDKAPVITRVRPPDLQLVSATPSPEPVGTASPVTIVAVVKNLGPGDADNPTVYFEPSEPGFAFVAAGSDPRCREVFPNGVHALCELPDNADGSAPSLAEGQSLSFSLKFTTPSEVKTVVTKVLAAANDETDKANNLELVISHVGQADVAGQGAVAIVPEAPPYAVGETLSVEATFTNTTADVDADNVVIEYTPTTTVAGVTEPVTLQSVGADGTGSCTLGAVLRCTFTRIAGGASAKMTVGVVPKRRGPLTHGFRVVSAGTPDPEPSNDRTALTTPISGYDLALVNVAEPLTLERDNNATWALRVVNDGPGVADGALLNLSFDTTYLGWVGNATNTSGGGCTPVNASLVQCPLGRLEKGDHVDLSWQIEPIKAFDVSQASDEHAATMDVDAVATTGDDERSPNGQRTLRRSIAGANLALTATGPDDPVQIDDPVNLHAIVANAGPAESKTARLHVSYDAARLEAVSTNDPQRPCLPIASGTLRCALDPLPAGAAGIDLGLSFKALAPGRAKVTLKVTDGPDETEETTPANNSAEVTATILGADIQVGNATQDPATPVSITRSVRYAFDVLNPSTKAKTPGFEAVLALGAAAAGKARIVNTSVGGTTPCAISQDERSASCTWTAGVPKASAAGTPAKVTVVVDTLGLDRGTYGVEGAVRLLEDAATDPNPANNVLPVGTLSTTREGHDLAVSATRDGAPFEKRRGEQVTYTAVVRNNHRTTAKAVDLVFIYPAKTLEKQTVSLPGDACRDYAPGVVTCALGDIPYDQSRTVAFVMDAVASGDAELIFSVAAEDNADNRDAPTSDDEVKPTLHVVGADLAVTGVNWPSGPLRSGETVDLQVTGKNRTTTSHTPAPSKAVTLTHEGFATAGQNPHLVYLGSSIGQATGGPSCVDNGAAVKCALGTLAADEMTTVYLRYRAGRAGTFAQTLTAAEPPGTKDEAPADNVATHQSEVKGPDLVITDGSADTPAGVGNDGVSVSARVTNTSTDTTARGVKLRFTYSQLSSGPAGGFVLTAANQPSGCAVKPDNVLECALGDLAPGASSALIGSLWSAEQVGDYRVVIVTESDAEDATPSDNSTIQAVGVKGPDIAVTGTPFTGTPKRGEPFTLNVAVDNVGLGESKETWVDLPLSPAVTFQSATVTPTGAGSCAAARLPSGADGVRCALGEVNRNELTRHIAVTLKAEKKGTYGFDFTGVTAPHADASAANQAASLSLDFAGADLAITGLTGPGTTEVNHGEELTFNVTVRNSGPADAIGPRLTNTTDPTRLTFLRAAGDGTCAVDATGLTTCALTGLQAGTGPTDYALIGLTYRAEKPGEVTSSFEVDEPGQSDENPADNTANKTTTVRGADLEVTMVDAPDPVSIGQDVTWTMTVTNHGPAKAKSVIPTFVRPREVKFVGASAGCKTSVRIAECAPYDLDVGASRVWTVTATAMQATTTASARANASSESSETGTHLDEVTVGTTIVDGDADSDGVSSQTEDGAPNGGDGNGDGVPDKDQPTVTSVPNGSGDYTTLETDAGALSAVASQAPPTPTPSGIAFPVDALSYEVVGLANGGAATVTITMPTGIPAWAYWKYGPEPGNATPHWYDFTFDGTTGARKIAPNQLEVVLVDGGRGDDDLTANGTIVDPGAPALRLLVVDATGDAPDASPGDGLCDVGDGRCTLRAAIDESNAHEAAHFIAFAVDEDALPIQITSAGGLPAITAPVVVDGATQPGWSDAPVVMVGAPRWPVAAGDSALRHLVLPGGVEVIGEGATLITDSETDVLIDQVDRCLVRRSALSGVTVSGPATANVIVDNDVAGAVALSDASATLVRGNAVHDAFSESAITISGGGATDNRVLGNVIGLDADGACTHFSSDPNTNTPGAGPCDGGAGEWGVHLTGGAWGNAIGAGGFDEGNLISGNGLGGVLIDGGAHGNSVAGNLFGTDRDGVAERHPVSRTYQLDNGGPCVRIDGASSNVVGGASEDERNVCAGRGMAVVGAASDGNVLRGNWIMLDARGDVPWVRLTLDDVLRVQDATDTVIADNVVPTIEVMGTASGTRIEGNRIGTDPTGLRAFYADQSIPGTTRIWSRGVLVHDSASGTTISDNVISGSYLHGVDIWEDASFVTVADNRVGVDATGTAALPNLKSGIHVDARYGGTVADVLVDGNVVAGNGTTDAWVSDLDWPFAGIWLREGAARVTVRDNTVGLGTDGVTPLPHLTHGIWANGAPDLAVIGNLVGANAGDGIRVDDGPLVSYPSDGAVLRGNIVGTDALGMLDLGNGGYGIRVHESGGVQVGGVGPGEGNTVAYNDGYAGVWVEAGGQGTTVRGNSLYDNGGLGLDLNGLGVDQNGVYDGVTNGDPDLPVLTTAGEDAGVITVSGTHGPALSGSYTLDFYLDQAPDPSGHGEGRAWLGSTALSGTDAFSVDLPRDGAVGAFISATATDATGNTSELSRFVWVDAAPAWTDVGVTLVEGAGEDPTCVGCLITWFAEVTVAGPDAADGVTLTFDYPAGVDYAGETPGSFTCLSSFPTTTCSAVSLSPGQYQVLFRGTTTAIGVITARASITTDTTDPAPLNDDDDEDTTVGPADLQLAVADLGPQAVDVPFELVATVSNPGISGGGTATATLTLPLPSAVSFVSAAGGSCSEAAGVVTCALPPLTADNAAELRLTVVAGEVGDAPFSLSVSAPNPDRYPANNTAATTVDVRERAFDLAVSQQVAPLYPEVGAPFDYTVTVTNGGPSPAFGVVLKNTPQIQAYPAAVTASQGECYRDQDSEGMYLGTVSCHLGDLASGASALVTLTAVTDQSLTLQNIACASAPGEDYAPGNDCETTVAAVGAVDLTPAVTIVPNPAEVGSELTVTAAVHNAGPATARATTIAVGLPYHLGFVSPQGPCEVALDTQTNRNIVTCEVGDVPANGDGAVAITLLASDAGEDVFMTAEVASDSLDLTASNDSGYFTLDITEAPPGPCPPERQVVLFSDSDESGGDGWMITIGDYCNLPDCSGAVWSVVDDVAYDGAHSWHVDGFDGKAQVSHRMVAPVSLVDVTEPVAVFHHRFDYQPGVDGAKVWVNPGSGFTQVPPVFTAGPPQAPTSAFFGGDAYTGQSPSWPGFDETRIDLSGHIGGDVRLIFQQVTDDATGGPGWWVDGVEIRACEDPGASEPSCPAGYELTDLLSDTTEAGGAGWGGGADDYCYAADCSQATWRLVTDAAHSGDHSWFGPTVDNYASLTLMGTADVDLTGDLSRPEALLFHRYDMEAYKDGGRIQLSADEGQSWTSVTYTMGASSEGQSIFNGEYGFTTTNPSWPGFDEVRLDLSAHLGQRVRLRFEARSDSFGATQGWWVDDVRIRACTKVVPPTDADLALTLTGPASLEAEVEPASYALTVENLGPLDATGVAVSVLVPEGLALSADGCDAALDGLICDVGELVSGERVELTLAGFGTARRDLDVVATVSGDQPDPEPANDTAAVATVVHANVLVGAHLALASAPDALTIGSGGTLTWEVSNLGPADGGLTLFLALPAGLDAVTPPGCDRAGAQVTCDLGVVPAGGPPGAIALDVTATSVGPQAVVAVVGLTEGVDPDALDPTPEDDAVVHRIDVGLPAFSADLAVSVTADAGSVLVGDQASFVVTVANVGPDLATDLTLALMTTGASLAAATDATDAGCDVAGCTLPALGPGESWEVVVTGLADSPGTLGVEAAITSATPDPEAANDTDESSVIAVSPVAGLSVAWIDPPATALADGRFTLTATVDNAGPLPAEATRLAVEVAEGRLVTVPDGCARAASGAGAWCELGDLGVAAHLELPFEALSDAAGDTAVVTATVATATVDGTAADDEAVAEVDVVTASADLALTASLETAASIAVGDLVSVRLDVVHGGGDPVVASRLMLALPPGAAAVDVTTDRGGCVAGSEAIACDLGALEADDTAQIDVAFVATAPGEHQVAATVAAPAVDTDAANDAASVAFSALLDCAGACDDGDPCTVASCDPLTGCAHGPAPDGTACDDADPCNVADACYAGTCIGAGPASCDDGDPCTLDTCDPTSGCVHAVAPLACDDGDACTTGDVCAAGSCTGTGTLDCDDGDDCTLDSCTADVGCHHTAAPGCCQDDGDCDDLEPCTADSCDLGTGDCVNAAVGDGTACDADGSACTDGDACSGGVCTAGATLDCDDGDPCTTDACDAVTGCTHGEIPGCCGDASGCPASASACAVPTCDGGVCGFAALADGSPCDADASVCTDGDACVDGACVAGSALACDDGDDCTVDSCDDVDGCQHAPSDDEACQCAPEAYAAACLGGDVVWHDACDEPGETAVVCDDGDAGIDDHCDVDSAVCLHVPAGFDDCDVACAGEWTRECLDGHVMWRDPCGEVAGVAAACSSADPCIVASCDEAAAACVFAPSTAAACGVDGGCDENRELACEAGDLVWRDGCDATLGPAVVCDDGAPGTDDACDPEALRCASVPSAADLPSRLCELGPADGVVEGDDVVAADVVEPEDDALTGDVGPDVVSDTVDPDGFEPDTITSDTFEPDTAVDDTTEPDTTTADTTSGDTERPGTDIETGGGGSGGCGDCSGGPGGGGLFGLLAGLWLLLRRRDGETRATGRDSHIKDNNRLH